MRLDLRSRYPFIVFLVLLLYYCSIRCVSVCLALCPHSFETKL